MTKKYNIIYADPPWSYDDKSMNRGGAERHYKTTHIDELCNISVNDIADDDCVLLMWATFPKIAEALKLIDAWGFTYKTNAFTWVKKNRKSLTNFWGMGRWTRSNAEICLLATKGKPKRESMAVHSIVEHPIMRHSKKPDCVRDLIIELCGDLPRIELFCRDAPEGWDTWGNECECSVDLQTKTGAY